MTSLPQCLDSTCELRDTLQCQFKGPKYRNCENYTKGHPETTQKPTQEITDLFAPMWTGKAISASRLGLVGGQQTPLVMALVGLPKSGKTSFLTSLFARIRQESLPEWMFAGSFTLLGWAALTRYTEWEAGAHPTYPPRTSGGQREPGFLHLALRDHQDELRDVLIADTPGEWYEQWVDREMDPTTLLNPAPWTVKHVDRVLLFVDTPALSSPRRNLVKDRTMGLIDRIAALGVKQVHVVYTKQDQEFTPNNQLTELQEHLTQRFPDHQAFQTTSVWSDPPGQKVIEAFLACLQVYSPQPQVKINHQPLLARWFTEAP